MYAELLQLLFPPCVSCVKCFFAFSADSFEMCKLSKYCSVFAFILTNLTNCISFVWSMVDVGCLGGKTALKSIIFCSSVFGDSRKYTLILRVYKNGQLSCSCIAFHFNLQTKTFGILSDLFSTISCTLWRLVYSLSETWLKLPEPTSLPAICQSHQVPCRQASWGQD